MSDYIIPILVILLLVCCIIKKIPAYSTFTEGAKDAIDLSISIFPALIAMFWCVELFRISGLSKIVADFIAPAFKFLGIPPEISELILIRPFTGSGSYAILSNIFETYGADSYISKCASVVMGSSETVFYISAIYFAGVKQKKLYIAIIISLFASLIGTITGCLIMRFV